MKSFLFTKIITALFFLIITGCGTTAQNNHGTKLGASKDLAGFMKFSQKKGQRINFTINPTRTGTIATCEGDDPAACDILAEACDVLGGTGQCGGDKNPTGCQCEF